MDKVFRCRVFKVHADESSTILKSSFVVGTSNLKKSRVFEYCEFFRPFKNASLHTGTVMVDDFFFFKLM